MSLPPAPGARVRVLVVDDHPVVRAGLVALLETAGSTQVVGEAGNGQEALDILAAMAGADGERGADVVLMDLRMPVMDGVAATGQIVTLHHGCAVLVLTTYDTDADIVRAIEAGATGYLLKDTPRAELIAGVHEAAAGRTVLAPSVAHRLVRRAAARSGPAPTPRELQVLAGVARGRTNADIGADLFITEATVKTHLLRLFGKLGVADRTRAVTVAIERGLLPTPRA